MRRVPHKNALAGRLRPAGRVFETSVLKPNLLYHLRQQTTLGLNWFKTVAYITIKRKLKIYFWLPKAKLYYFL